MNMPMRRGTTQHWIPSIFNDFFDNNWMVRTNTTAPAINVLENEKEYTIEVAAPGMTKSDFKIQMDAENDLTITMEKGCNCCCNKEGQKEEQKETAKPANNEELTSNCGRSLLHLKQSAANRNYLLMKTVANLY